MVEQRFPHEFSALSCTQNALGSAQIALHFTILLTSKWFVATCTFSALRGCAPGRPGLFVYIFATADTATDPLSRHTINRKILSVLEHLKNSSEYFFCQFLTTQNVFIYFQASKKLNEMLGALYPPEPTPAADPEKEESSEETKPNNFPSKKTAAQFLASDEDPEFIAYGEK